MSEFKRVAKFEKVSFDEYKKAFDDMDLEEIKGIYDSIKLPKRATKGSAGYDFYSPIDITLKPGETVKIPTGIRCKMEDNYVLKLYPRSGLGFKYRLQLNNTVGIIDSDYYNSDNEGHIMIKLVYEGFKNSKQDSIVIKSGTAFVQGILHEVFGALNDSDTEFAKRNGGLGSTTK